VNSLPIANWQLVFGLWLLVLVFGFGFGFGSVFELRA
jgi:hypothetical protein